MKKVGVISDNHGYINPKVFPLFEDVEVILHAGDIGPVDIITALETIAPVSAVFGNVDTFPIVGQYPEILTLTIDAIRICMLHEFKGLDELKLQSAVQNELDAEPDILICGHSHKAKVKRIGETFILNPGSAGKPRFSLRPAVGFIKIFGHRDFTLEITYLD